MSPSSRITTPLPLRSVPRIEAVIEGELVGGRLQFGGKRPVL
jgi:hypothetical protein